MQRDVFFILLMALVATAVGVAINFDNSTDPDTTGNNCCSIKCGGCDKKSWSSWGSCSQSCGGGTQSRTYKYECRCLLRICTMKDCGRFSESRSCNQVCVNDGKYVGGSQPCDCSSLYYGRCCENDCPKIQYCSDSHYGCDTGPPSTCTQCQQYAGSHYSTSAYWLNNNKCSPRCNWVDDWCWPGTCDSTNEYLASTCSCIEGFQKATDNAKCELAVKPVIEVCKSTVTGPNGETTRSHSSSCVSTPDIRVTFHPKLISFDFQFHLPLPVDPSTIGKHHYVEDSGFGIVKGVVDLKYYNQSGGVTTIKSLEMSEDVTCNANFSSLEPATGLISCQSVYAFDHLEVEDGTKLCHHFRAEGSGFVRIRSMVDNSTSTHLYQPTTDNIEKCVFFDFSKPTHCKTNSTPCCFDPLDIGPRIQRHKFVHARFHGYYDPEPGTVETTASSGIQSYNIEIREMVQLNDQLVVRPQSIKNYTAPNNEEQLDLELPVTDQPKMYAIILKIFNAVGNSRLTRRFVIYDNYSSLALDEDQHYLRPISASPETNYTWQVTKDPVVVDWNEYFYNVHYKSFNFLLPVKEDNRIEGVYEQLDEPLPATGTPNVHGITSFFYKYDLISPSGDTSTGFQQVADVLDQQVTIPDLLPSDGDSLDVTVLAQDINRNKIEDSFQMFFDSSQPELMDLGLVPDECKLVFHPDDVNITDFTFNAFDEHSGLQEVTWTFGPYQENATASGHLPVVTVSNKETCEADPHCYCPLIGECSMMNYSIPLSDVLAGGLHERVYYFWVQVVNSALLTTQETTVIMVDENRHEHE